VIILYSGKPGSGKSYHIVKTIISYLRHGKDVYTNVELNKDRMSEKMRRHYFYVNFKDISPEVFSTKRYKREGEALICIDESQLIFNNRFMEKYKQWLWFLSQHRKFGYDIILASQSDRMLERGVRSLIEFEIRHKPLWRIFPFFLLPFKVGLRIERWYGERVGKTIIPFILRKKYYSYYNTMQLMSSEELHTEEIKTNQRKLTTIATEWLKKVRNLDFGNLFASKKQENVS